jgi:hypothetical protein
LPSWNSQGPHFQNSPYTLLIFSEYTGATPADPAKIVQPFIRSNYVPSTFSHFILRRDAAFPTRALSTLQSGLSSSTGDFIAIESLFVRGEWTSTTQPTVNANITAEFFGSGMHTYIFEFQPDDLWETVQTLMENSASQFSSWVNGQLDGTAAEPYMTSLYAVSI